MNELDKSIEQARQKRFIYTIVIGGLLLAGLVVYAIWLFLAKGYVINVKPEEAQPNVFVHVTEGQGLYLGGVLYTFSDKTRIEVGAKDFESQTLFVDPSTESTISVTLKPSPGVLSARTEPSDQHTQWFIDSKLVHVGEVLEHRAPPGDYTVGVNNKYYQPLQETVSLQRNQVLEKVWPLKKVEGEIVINTTPDNAQVSIDGSPIGSSPLSLQRSSGAYRIVVSAKGYELIEDTVDITNETPQVKRNYLLEPKKGSISLSLSPQGGELIVGGTAINNISRTGEVTVPVVANTSHILSYNKPGYFAYEQRIKLSPGETKQLTIALKKEFGTVNINATPGTAILVDGKPAGKTALKTRLPAVKHKLEFVLPGHRTQIKYVTPSSRSDKNINIRMLTEYDARRKEGKPLFISTLGISMQEVRPSAFVMGSPPNQRGRRRNEFPVQVDFTRNILVGHHEITEAQYAAFDATKPNTSLPVTNISWSDAVRYCNWLSEKEGLPPFYKINNGRVIGFNVKSKGYRLLTEAEWEWLASKAQRSSKTVYVWGNNERIPKKAGNFADKSLASGATFYFRDYDDGFSGKAPVGSFKADRVGLFDLAGNVSEWVHDRYTNTPPDISVVKKDYTGASRGVDRVYKGGNYKSGRQSELRGAFREGSKNGSPVIGFRIARYL